MAMTDEKHPKGLYVLFATEMWERFSFYTMLAMLTLYMRDSIDGFAWSTAKSTDIYSFYIAFVYASPLIGGWLADKFLGYRLSISIGGIFFMMGHLLLAVPKNVPIFFTALVCLVIGNGFFKPNVSSMVGNLYREGSHLKDRAYLIFYMGINIGAFIAPIVAEFVQQNFGFHPAFAVAAFGMMASLAVFWSLKRHTAHADKARIGDFTNEGDAKGHAEAVAVTEDVSPSGASEAADAMSAVPEWKRIFALIVIFAIVIVFWMVFHQNGSTLTYWANDNTNWKEITGPDRDVSGIISNAINPFWIIVLSLPLAGFWGWLDKKGLEPSTPMKMTVGMLLTGLSFFILYFAAQSGGYTLPSTRIIQAGPEAGTYWANLPDDLRETLGVTTIASPIEVPTGEEGATRKVDAWLVRSSQPLPDGQLVGISKAGPDGIDVVPQRKVSPWWLILAYFVISLGELMLSPMGLSLVSKVAPARMRGLMMGGWFLATAIGNKLTAIGAYWDVWSHAKFFMILGSMAVGMAVVLFILLRPLKRAMPGV